MKKYILLSLLSLTIASGINLVGMEPEKTCDICWEEKRNNEFNPLSCCTHEASCNDCLLEIINSSLRNKTTDDIVCPNKKCVQPIQLRDVSIITKKHPEIYTKYLDVAAYKYMTHEKGIKHCPTPNCPFSFINDAGLKHKFKCPSCTQIYCSNCLVQHGPQMTCKEAVEHAQIIGDTSKEAYAHNEWLQKNTKACPKCNTVIQKNGGCFHMKCGQCKYDFCWKCLNHHDGTHNHPCGFYGNAADMNQAHQELIGNQNVNPVHQAGHHAMLIVLDQAMRQNNFDVIRRLIEAGANIDRPNNGRTPMFIHIRPIIIDPLDQAVMQAGLTAEQIEAVSPAVNAALNNVFHGGNVPQNNPMTMDRLLALARANNATPANQQQANPLPRVTIPNVIQQMIDEESGDDDGDVMDPHSCRMS